MKTTHNAAMAQGAKAAQTVYSFEIIGKKANILWEIKPSKDLGNRLKPFLTANITERVTKLFTLKYARNFSKGTNLEVKFSVNGITLNTADIASTVGINLKPNKANEATIYAKICEVIEAGLVMADNTDYSQVAEQVATA